MNVNEHLDAAVRHLRKAGIVIKDGPRTEDIGNDLLMQAQNVVWAHEVLAKRLEFIKDVEE